MLTISRLIPEDMPCSDIVETVSEQQGTALRALYPILGDLNCCTDWDVEMGQDVTLHHQGMQRLPLSGSDRSPKPFEKTEQQIKDLPTAGGPDA